VDAIQKIQDWFISQCDGKWEHQKGISIESCDNPGWSVKIDIRDTQLQDRVFIVISRNIASDGHPVGPDWIHCHIENLIWNGAGDASKLEEILEAFCEWAA